MLWALAGLAWLAVDNARAWARYRSSLLPGRADRVALFAWLLSLLSTWMGPFMPIGAVLALALGIHARRKVMRGEARARSELPAEMARRNALVVLAVFVGVGLAIWSGWQAMPVESASDVAPFPAGSRVRHGEGDAHRVTRLALAGHVGQRDPPGVWRNS